MSDLAFMYSDFDASLSRETGFLGKLFDAAAGGPQKRRRTRANLAKAAALKAEAERLRAEALAATTSLAVPPLDESREALAYLRAHLEKPSAVFGLPVWQASLAAGVAAWALSPVMPKTVGLAALVGAAFVLGDGPLPGSPPVHPAPWITP